MPELCRWEKFLSRAIWRLQYLHLSECVFGDDSMNRQVATGHLELSG